ncbi:MAG TPA: hypothetical protein VFR86_16405 [Burkholderiaceae bacterium]|nr:hypothetical protein [Burkholderiaceae bacterium]
MRIVLDDRKVRHAWLTGISGDASELNGYFSTDLPAQGVIEFGYDGEVRGRVPQGFDAKPVHRLDRKRLPKGVVEPTEVEINPS